MWRRHPSTFHLARRSSWSSPELYPPSKRFQFRRPTRQSKRFVLALLPAASPCLFKLAVAFGVDLVGEPAQTVGWRDVADRCMQSDLVVMIDIIGGLTLRFVVRPRTSWSNAFFLDRAMKVFQLSVALRVVRTGRHMRHPAERCFLLVELLAAFRRGATLPAISNPSSGRAKRQYRKRPRPGPEPMRPEPAPSPNSSSASPASSAVRPAAAIPWSNSSWKATHD